MKRYLIVGALVVAAVLVALAPASLLQQGLAGQSNISLQQPRGTLWNGSGALQVQGQSLGTLQWSLLPGRLITGSLALSYQLGGAGLDLTGEAGRSFSSWQANADGTVAPALMNRLLAPYDIKMSGRLQPQAVETTLQDNVLQSLNGQVSWAGGPVSYVLEGPSATKVLPPMRAELGMSEDSQPIAQVYSDTVNYPVVTLRLMDDGFVKVSLTRHFTQMVDMPWPGSEPDHAVVLEVEQQVF